MSRHRLHRGYGPGQPTPNYHLPYSPYDSNAAVYIGQGLSEWQVIDPGSFQGARSAGFGAGAAAGLGDEPDDFYGYGPFGPTSYEPESLYGDQAFGATSYIPTQSRSHLGNQHYGNGSYDYETLHHGSSYEPDAHDGTSHKKGKGRAHDASTSQRPRHPDVGRSGGNQDEQLLRDQMMAMSLQQQEYESPLANVVGEPHRHRAHDHHHVGSSRKHSGYARSRAHRHEHNDQSTSSLAHQAYGRRHRARGDGSDSYLGSHKTISSKTQDHHGGGSKRSSRKAACVACLDEYLVADLYKLCPNVGCPSVCAKCAKYWFKSAVKAVPKQTIMCCNRSLPIPDAIAHLFRPDFVEEYKSIMMEFDTKNKVYCSYKKCSAFIPPPTIEGKNATCQKCGRQTCTRCKNASHSGKPCRSNPDDEKVKDLAQRKGWQQCPGCQLLTSREWNAPDVVPTGATIVAVNIVILMVAGTLDPRGEPCTPEGNPRKREP